MSSVTSGSSSPNLEVYDRDWGGNTVSSHSLNLLGDGAYGYGAWQGPGPAARTNCKTGVTSKVYPMSSVQDGTVATGAATGKSDGYTVDVITLQGVRSYDPDAGQWTTPDAYAGDVHDPMSQKPFMWNRNNAYEYSDPSGYSSDRETQRAMEAELLGTEMAPMARAQLQRALSSMRGQSQFETRLGNFRGNLSTRAIKAAAERAVTGGESAKGGKFDHLQDVSDQLRGLQNWSTRKKPQSTPTL